MSTSTTSSDGDVPMRQRKRYKLPFNPDYNPDQVCKRTHLKWTASYGSATSSTAVQLDQVVRAVGFSYDTSTTNSEDNINLSIEAENIQAESSDNSKHETSDESHSHSNSYYNYDAADLSNGRQSDNLIHSFQEESNQSEGNANENNNYDDDSTGCNSYNKLDDVVCDSNNSGESESDDEETAFDDRIMFSESGMSVRDVMTLVMAYSLRFKVSDTQRESLIDILKLLAGPQANDINISKYRFKQAFDPPDDKIIFHYY